MAKVNTTITLEESINTQELEWDAEDGADDAEEIDSEDEEVHESGAEELMVRNYPSLLRVEHEFKGLLDAYLENVVTRSKWNKHRSFARRVKMVGERHPLMKEDHIFEWVRLADDAADEKKRRNVVVKRFIEYQEQMMKAIKNAERLPSMIAVIRLIQNGWYIPSFEYEHYDHPDPKQRRYSAELARKGTGLVRNASEVVLLNGVDFVTFEDSRFKTFQAKLSKWIEEACEASALGIKFTRSFDTDYWAAIPDTQEYPPAADMPSTSGGAPLSDEIEPIDSDSDEEELVVYEPAQVGEKRKMQIDLTAEDEVEIEEELVIEEDPGIKPERRPLAIVCKRKATRDEKNKEEYKVRYGPGDFEWVRRSQMDEAVIALLPEFEDDWSRLAKVIEEHGPTSVLYALINWGSAYVAEIAKKKEEKARQEHSPMDFEAHYNRDKGRRGSFWELHCDEQFDE